MNDATLYDALLEAGREPPPPCPVCTGDYDAGPCSEQCEAVMHEIARRRRIRGLYQEAKRALRLAREYRIGDATSDFRQRMILRRVYLIRCDIADLRKAA